MVKPDNHSAIIKDLPSGDDLDRLAGAYSVHEAQFAAAYIPLAAVMANRISQYKTLDAKPYGAEQLWPHLQRVAKDGAEFLSYLGVSDVICANFASAYLFSDIGKIHPDYADIDWQKDDRPTPAEKELRRQHTVKGIAVLDKLMTDMGIAAEYADHPHFTLMKSLMVLHHERMDGQGQLHIPGEKLGLLAQVACLVDALDGDMIPRGHQLEGGRTLAQALDRLSGRTDPKYAGAFAPNLLDRYNEYKRISQLCSPSPL